MIYFLTVPDDHTVVTGMGHCSQSSAKNRQMTADIISCLAGYDMWGLADDRQKR